jgi:hypothetical protein
VWQHKAAAGNSDGRAAIQSIAHSALTGWCVMQDQKETGVSGVGCLVRIFWMLFGHGIAWLVMASIFVKRPPIPSAYDLVYWLLVGALVLARYVDIRYHNGQLAYSEGAATLKHWRRYAVLLVIVYLLAWVSAHSLGRLLS